MHSDSVSKGKRSCGHIAGIPSVCFDSVSPGKSTQPYTLAFICYRWHFQWLASHHTQCNGPYTSHEHYDCTASIVLARLLLGSRLAQDYHRETLGTKRDFVALSLLHLLWGVNCYGLACKCRNNAHDDLKYSLLIYIYIIYTEVVLGECSVEQVTPLFFMNSQSVNNVNSLITWGKYEHSFASLGAVVCSLQKSQPVFWSQLPLIALSY